MPRRCRRARRRGNRRCPNDRPSRALRRSGSRLSCRCRGRRARHSPARATGRAGFDPWRASPQRRPVPWLECPVRRQAHQPAPAPALTSTRERGEWLRPRRTRVPSRVARLSESGRPIRGQADADHDRPGDRRGRQDGLAVGDYPQTGGVPAEIQNAALLAILIGAATIIWQRLSGLPTLVSSRVPRPPRQRGSDRARTRS